MIKKIGLCISVLAAVVLQSCSVNTETTYYPDAATSMQSNILMDSSLMGFLSMMGETPQAAKKESGINFNQLPTDWKSLYDIQKTGKITLNDKEAQTLKKMFLKLNKKDGDVTGLSIKYHKLMPKEVAEIFTTHKELKNVPLNNIGSWNGSKLTIDTEKFNVAEALTEIQKVKPEETSGQPKTKKDSIEAYGRQMASGMVGMMKMFSMNFTNTLKFQRPVKQIEGKHDFVQQVDKNTIRINVRTADLWDEGKNLKNKDKKIVIITE